MSLHCIVWCCMVLYCWLWRAGCISQDTYLLYDYDYDEDDDNYNDANFLLSVKWHLCGTNSPTFYLKGGQLNRAQWRLFGGKC